MKAIILAAGVGSRLNPITGVKPKCLVRVGGKPIIAYQIEAYLASGLKPENIIVVGGYRAEMMSDYLENHFPGVVLLDNTIYDTTNNMYSLYFAFSKFEIEADGIIINNGDCIYDYGIVDGIVNNSNGDRIAVHKDIYQAESMKVTLAAGIIKTISKETAEAEAYGVSIDLYRLSFNTAGQLFEIMKDYIEVKQEKKLWTEVALQDLLGKANFIPYDIKNHNWIEIDDHKDLLTADRIFSNFDIGQKKSVICDLDGTVYLGKQPIDGTIQFIKKHTENKEFFFLTNNTSKIPVDYVDRLHLLGIATDNNHIMAPHIPLIKYLQEEKINNIFLIANQRYTQFLKSEQPELNINDNPENCQAVIVAYDTELTYEKLKKAALILQKEDVKFLATHSDKVCPTELGPIPDAGSILALLESSTGRKPDKIFGKPNQELLSTVFQTYKSREIVIVGDRLYTDKVLADRAGIDFILVLSGESTRFDAEKSDSSPTSILNNLGDLL